MPVSVQELYKSYRTTLKPLIAEYESQNEAFVTSWLDHISQLFDRIALSETEDSFSKQQEHLEMASKHLNDAISDARRSVMASMITRIGTFKARYGKNVIERISDGKFVGPFNALEDEVRQAIDHNDTLAYDKLLQMITMIQKAHGSALANSLTTDGKQMTMLKWLVSILVSLIITYVVSLIW